MLQSQFAPMTIPRQTNQWEGYTPRVQSMAYNQQVSFVNYGYPRMASTSRGGQYTQYGSQNPYQQASGPQYAVGNQLDCSSPQNAGYNMGGQNPRQLLEAQQMYQEPTSIYNHSVPGDFWGQCQAHTLFSEMTPTLPDVTRAGEEDLTLFTNEGQTILDGILTKDAHSGDTMTTIAEPLLQSSQESSEVEQAVLAQVGSYVNAPTTPPFLARPSQQSHKRKRSAESNLSTSSKKSRAEKAADREAERARIAAERKAQEPPMSAEQREARRRFEEIRQKVDRKQPVTEEELRTFIPDGELDFIRGQFAGMETLHVDELNDDELRRTYAFQRSKFKSEHNAWEEKLNQESIARRKSNRQKRTMKA